MRLTALIVLLLATSALSFPIVFDQYIDTVDPNANYIDSWDSLEGARQGSRGVRNVIYIVQKLRPNGDVYVYVGETVADVASRYGTLTSGLRDVIGDRWDDNNVNVDVFELSGPVQRTDETVIRDIRDDMINGVADVRLRLRNRRGLMKGLSKAERKDFRDNFNALEIASTAELQVFARVKGGGFELVLPKKTIETAFEKDGLRVGAKGRSGGLLSPVWEKTIKPALQKLFAKFKRL